MARNLTGKVLIITGASSGIGAATAIEAGRHGMRVVLAARRREKLEAVAREVEAVGGKALIVPTDVADAQQVRRLVDQAVETFGTVDIMFANAGFGYMGEFVDADRDVERQMWEVNYFGTVRCVRAAAAVMRQRGSGHILICSSVVARFGLPYYGTYSATKAAQHGLIASLQGELPAQGIDVTGVYPAGTRTEFFDSVVGRCGADGISENTPAVFMKSAKQVDRAIIAAMRRPKPEVWPSFSSKFGATIWTMFPRLRQFCMGFHARWCRRTIERSRATPPAESLEPRA